MARFRRHTQEDEDLIKLFKSELDRRLTYLRAKCDRSFEEESELKKLENTGLVLKEASMFLHASLHAHLTFLDLVQEGFEGLCVAERRYESGKGTTFSTYARYWIRAYMLNALRNSIGTRGVRIPVHMLDQIRDFKKTKLIYARRKGRDPDRHELTNFCARLHGQNAEDIAAILYALSVHGVNLTKPISRTKGESRLAVQDTLASEAELGREFESYNFVATVSHLLHSLLTEREREILVHSLGLFGVEKTSVQALAERFQVTTYQIQRDKKRALEELRDFLTYSIPSDTNSKPDRDGA